MARTQLLSPDQAGDVTVSSQQTALAIDNLEKRLSRNRTVAWAVVVGLPVMGALASLAGGLPLFAGLMAGFFLVAASLVITRAVTRFVSQTLRLLVSARMVVTLVVAALLLAIGGAPWMAVVSAVLVWLVADRLLGRQALTELGKRKRE